MHICCRAGSLGPSAGLKLDVHSVHVRQSQAVLALPLQVHKRVDGCVQDRHEARNDHCQHSHQLHARQRLTDAVSWADREGDRLLEIACVFQGFVHPPLRNKLISIGAVGGCTPVDDSMGKIDCNACRHIVTADLGGLASDTNRAQRRWWHQAQSLLDDGGEVGQPANVRPLQRPGAGACGCLEQAHSIQLLFDLPQSMRVLEQQHHHR
mmetsp:Transcript_39600/g.117816  ORF Transcript_39600/g.117816 Transcript_39600/m.117816 type:complete len:209 (-) Transcript_39600:1079-1705(-)